MVAHELFHAWNARRLRPAELVPYDLSQRAASRSLWITEGLTEYFAHRAMLRRRPVVARRISGARRRRGDARGDGGAARRAPSRRTAELTWQPPDEATDDPDAYYARGHLVALALDAAMRAASDGQHALDDVLRALLADGRCARAACCPSTGECWRARSDRVAPGVAAKLLQWARGGGEADARRRARRHRPGARVQADAGAHRRRLRRRARRRRLRVVAVVHGGPAALAGLEPGDRILTIDGAPPRALADDLAARALALALAAAAPLARSTVALRPRARAANCSGWRAVRAAALARCRCRLAPAMSPRRRRATCTAGWTLWLSPLTYVSHSGCAGFSAPRAPLTASKKASCSLRVTGAALAGADLAVVDLAHRRDLGRGAGEEDLVGE